MMTVINGGRTVAFLLNYTINDYYDEYIKDNPNVDLMTVKRDGDGIYGDAYILYSDLNRAKNLYRVLQKHEGYLPCNSPEEIIENGEALEYVDADIKSFTDSKFGEGAYDKIKSEY